MPRWSMLPANESNSRANLSKRASRMDCRVKPGNDEIGSRSRHTFVPEFCLQPHTEKIRPRQQKGGEAPKGAMPTITAHRRQVYAVCANHLLRGCAPFSEARPPSGASTAALAGTPIPAQPQAMLPATWNQAGVTRPILSQSSDSTSRLGRSTEGNDAQSRSGADCEPAHYP